MQSGTIELRGSGTSSGEFDVSSGAALTFDGGMHNLAGATINNAGTLSFTAGVLADDLEKIDNSGTLTVQNSSLVNVSAIEGSGATMVTGSGSVLTAGYIYQTTLSIGAGATVIIAPLPGGPLTNNNCTPVPEPATWLILTLGGIFVIWRRLKRYGLVGK